MALSLTEVHLTQSQDAPAWELWAQRGFRYSDSNELRLEEVKVKFTTDQEEPFQIEAQEGLVNLKTKDLSLQGQILVQSPHGHSFKTPHLLYSSSLHRLDSSNSIEVTWTQKEKVVHRIQASKMSLNLHTLDTKIQGGVTVKGFTQSKEPFVIKSQEALLKIPTHSIQFLKEVHLHINQTEISGHKAQLNYHKETGTISSLKVLGQVKAQSRSGLVRAQEAHIYPQKKECVFTGQPIAIQGENELRGEKIVLYGQEPSIRVYKARVKMKKEKEKEAQP